MKKVLFTILAVGLFGGLGSGFAQPNVGSADHALTIVIPSLLGVRIVDTDGTLGVNPAILFDYMTDPTTYIAAASTSGSLAPTSTPEFSSVQVMHNTGAWHLTVSALDSGLASSNIDLADITIVPSAPVGPVTNTYTQTLNTTASTVADGARTIGWVDVGITGSSYTLAVHGDETPGTYTTTVTYTLFDN